MVRCVFLSQTIDFPLSSCGTLLKTQEFDEEEIKIQDKMLLFCYPACLGAFMPPWRGRRRRRRRVVLVFLCVKVRADFTLTFDDSLGNYASHFCQLEKKTDLPRGCSYI